MSLPPADLREAARLSARGWLAAVSRAFQDETATIEDRLFRNLTLVGGLMALFVVIPMNLLQDLAPTVNHAVGLFGVLCLVLCGATFGGFYGTKSLFLLLVALLDWIWFSNGGSLGSIGMFLFTEALYLVIFFQGRTRWLMLAFYLVNGLGLLWFERLHPEWVIPFASRDVRLLDLATGFLVCSVVCVIILWVVLSAYHRERERLGAALTAQSASEARFRSLVADAPIPMSVANAQGDIGYLNRSFQEVLGYSLEDLPNLEAWWEKAYPDPGVRGRVMAQWNQAVATAVAAGTPVPPRVYRVVCKDGRTASMEIQASLIGEHVLAMFSDVSERQRSEEALRQTQKLESLGVLAGGIAHDFNNLLGAMLGNLNLAQMKLSPGAASGRYLEDVESTIGKAVELTRQMLAYSGKGRFVVELLDLNRHVGEISHLLAVSISKKVRLDYELAPDLPAIEADRAQLQQVVMNLAINASEAIGDDEGAITIATGLRDIAKKEAETAFVGQDLARGGMSPSGCRTRAAACHRRPWPASSTPSSAPRVQGADSAFRPCSASCAAIRPASRSGRSPVPGAISRFVSGPAKRRFPKPQARPLRTPGFNSRARSSSWMTKPTSGPASPACSPISASRS